MSFDTEIKADLDAILADGVFVDPIRIKAPGGPWTSLNAFVEDEREDLTVGGGLAVHGKVGPIYVTISKTDAATVKVNYVVEYTGMRHGKLEYTVRLIDTQDAAGWRLYCVR